MNFPSNLSVQTGKQIRVAANHVWVWFRFHMIECSSAKSYTALVTCCVWDIYLVMCCVCVQSASTSQHDDTTALILTGKSTVMLIDGWHCCTVLQLSLVSATFCLSALIHSNFVPRRLSRCLHELCPVKTQPSHLPSNNSPLCAASLSRYCLCFACVCHVYFET